MEAISGIARQVPTNWQPGTADNPDGTLIAGATDVGLWVTKNLADPVPVAFLNRCADLQTIEVRMTRSASAPG